MRVIVTGDRRWNCPELAENVLSRLQEKHGNEVVLVVGDAEGVDASFYTAAKNMGMPVERHTANWDKLGKGAGTVRNRMMVEGGANMLIACHRFIAKSRGTKDCVRQAMQAEIPVYLIDSDQVNAVRIYDNDKRIDY